MKDLSLTILIFLFLISYTITFAEDKDYPPIPEEKMSVTQELRYIYETDQKDREFMLDSTKEYSGFMSINDSIRLSRVIELDTNGLIRTNIQKYYAAFIYNHTGGSKMKNDSIYFLRAIKLCDEILNSDSNQFISDTNSLTELKKNALFNTLKNLILDYREIDTLIDKKSKDTLLIIKTPVKAAAKGLKYLAELEYNQRFIEKEKSEPIHLDGLENPKYRKKVKEKLRKKIIKQLKEQNRYNMLTKEQIDMLVEESFQNLINTKKSLIEDIKKNPDKYFKENKEEGGKQ